MQVPCDIEEIILSFIDYNSLFNIHKKCYSKQDNIIKKIFNNKLGNLKHIINEKSYNIIFFDQVEIKKHKTFQKYIFNISDKQKKNFFILSNQSMIKIFLIIKVNDYLLILVEQKNDKFIFMTFYRKFIKILFISDDISNTTEIDIPSYGEFNYGDNTNEVYNIIQNIMSS